MAQYRINNGQYRNRAKTYAKRTAAVGGAYVGANALLTGSRRGRRVMGKMAAYHKKRGDSVISKGIIKTMKASAGYRSRVRGFTGTAARVLGRLLRR